MSADVTTVRAVRGERRGGGVLFVGRLAQKQGVAVLLEAMRSGGQDGLSVTVPACTLRTRPPRGPP